MTKDKILLKGGCVLSMDASIGTLQQGDVLLEGNQIAAVAPKLEVGDCEVIDAKGKIVMPGLIDTHRHLWETALRATAADWSLMQYLQQILGPLAASYRPEDVYVGTLLGSLEALNAGITTLFDWSHIQNSAAHTDQAIMALQASNMRAVFGYGTPGTSVWEWFYESKLTHPQDAHRVREEYFSAEGQLLSMALAIRGPEYSSLAVSEHDIQLARELGIRISMHAGCGGFGPKYNAVAELHKKGLLGPDINVAHGNTLTDEDFQLLAAHGCSLSITPEVEMQMGLGMPATGRALKNGIRPSLGVDIVTGTAGDLFSQMKIALQTERALQNEQMLKQSEMPQVQLKAKDVLQFATVDGATALGLEHVTGSLSPGKQADVIMIDCTAINMAPVLDPVAAVVLLANPANVDAVFVAGKAVKREGRLLHADVHALQQKAIASAEYLMEKAAIAEKVLV
ncbi:amidohydrolase family protein [Pleomorphovibrio marinus]|uniref:amidohydrolase family protein n=1 Tax=Pleomorphovibrio marinus TaxID=2164132 RepID=UPI000E09E21E|nr:amidohydrolase family protein [Pleomorphovibrio marinus]